MKKQSYTSTPPMGRTACTEPQCLYKGALYLYLYLTNFERSSSDITVLCGPQPLSKIVLHCSRCCDLRLKFLMPTFFWSSSTDSNYSNLCFPTRGVLSGLKVVNFLQGSSSCILKRCPSHLSLCTFIILTTSNISEVYHTKYVANTLKINQRFPTRD